MPDIDDLTYTDRGSTPRAASSIESFAAAVWSGSAGASRPDDTVKNFRESLRDSSGRDLGLYLRMGAAAEPWDRIGGVSPLVGGRADRSPADILQSRLLNAAETIRAQDATVRGTTLPTGETITKDHMGRITSIASDKRDGYSVHYRYDGKTKEASIVVVHDKTTKATTAWYNADGGNWIGVNNKGDKLVAGGDVSKERSVERLLRGDKHRWPELQALMSDIVARGKHEKPEGKPSPGSHGKPFPDSHGKPFPDSHGKPFPDSHGKPFPDSHGKPFPDSHGKPFPDSHGKPFPDSHGKPFPDSHGKPYPGGHGKPFPDSHGKPLPEGHGKPIPDSHGKPFPDSHGKPFPDSHGKPFPDSHGKPFPDSHGKPLPVSHGKPVPESYRPERKPTERVLPEASRLLPDIRPDRTPSRTAFEAPSLHSRTIPYLPERWRNNPDYQRAFAGALNIIGKNAGHSVDRVIDAMTPQQRLALLEYVKDKASHHSGTSKSEGIRKPPSKAPSADSSVSESDRKLCGEALTNIVVSSSFDPGSLLNKEQAQALEKVLLSKLFR